MVELPTVPSRMPPSHAQRLLRGLVVAVTCLGVLAGCGGRSPRYYPVPESRRLEADIGSVWEAVARVLAERHFNILRSDRATGTIETDWLSMNTSYAANVFLTTDDDRYSDCGKPGLGAAFRGKHARLTVTLSPAGTAQTDVLMAAAFRTERTRVFSDSLNVRECRSRGRLEDELLVETQVRALANTLQRFRRGWQ
jgi:hypothetical protein